jgi:hypothetical protein
MRSDATFSSSASTITSTSTVNGTNNDKCCGKTTHNDERIHLAVEQLNLLCQEIKDLLLINGKSAPPNNFAETQDNILKNKRVIVSSGTYSGLYGTLSRPRGIDFWYIVLDDGREVYKKRANFVVLDTTTH